MKALKTIAVLPLMIFGLGLIGLTLGVQLLGAALAHCAEAVLLKANELDADERPNIKRAA